MVTPTFASVTTREYNEGATIPALPALSDNGISGIWSPTINNSETTIYTFTPASGECVTAATLEIKINKPVSVPVNANAAASYVIHISAGQLIVDNLNGETIRIYNTVGQAVVTNATSPVNVSAFRGVYVVKIGTFIRKVVF